MDEKRNAERTGRAAARPARVALTHATGVLLTIVAVLSLFSAKAYALPGSELNGYPLGEIGMNERIGDTRATYVYGAANNFFATLCLIGRKSDYLQLSNEQLAELSNADTGGAFYELSLCWNNYALDGRPIPDDGYSVGFLLSIDAQSLITDPDYIWWGEYSYWGDDPLYQRALDDYMTIYNGGHLGGGGGSSWSSTFTTNVNLGYTYVGKNYAPAGSTVYHAPVSPIMMHISDSVYANLQNRLGQYENMYYLCTGSRSNSSSTSNSYLIFSDDVLTPTYSSGSFSVTIPSGALITPCAGLYNVWSNSGGTFDGSIYDVNYTSWNSNYTTVTNRTLTATYTTVAPTSNGSTSKCVLWYDASGSAPVIPPTNWPDPPENPTVNPPEVPEPDEPTGPGIDPPNPIGYTIDPTDDPDPVTDPYVVVVAPDSQDIIPWLRAILQAINNLGDKLNDESTELQRALNDVFFGNLSKLLKNLKGEFLQDFTQWLGLEHEWMMESIESLILDLQDYLHDLFEWLADQMNFEFDVSTDPYDDTSLLNWLRRIYNKLGSDGGPNTRPVDPSTDPEGFLDWLRRMIAEFILGLGASASDFVSDLGDLLSRLFAKFPFSVPWDLLGILGLLDAAPVAPRANFTIPLTIGNQEFNWTVDINLTGWSTYMESVRTIILVSFISWLAWLTPNVLRDLDPGDFL